jgi:hypothetical protein
MHACAARFANLDDNFVRLLSGSTRHRLHRRRQGKRKRNDEKSQHGSLLFRGPSSMHLSTGARLDMDQ